MSLSRWFLIWVFQKYFRYIVDIRNVFWVLKEGAVRRWMGLFYPYYTLRLTESESESVTGAEINRIIFSVFLLGLKIPRLARPVQLRATPTEKIRFRQEWQSQSNKMASSDDLLLRLFLVSASSLDQSWQFVKRLLVAREITAEWELYVP